MAKLQKQAMALFCVLTMIVQVFSPFHPMTAKADTLDDGVTVLNDGDTSGEYAAPETPAVTYNMNIDWKYKRAADDKNFPLATAKAGVAKDGKQFYEVGYDDSDWETVSVPHAVNADDSFDGAGLDAGEASLYRGFMFYRKTFTVPKSDAGKKFILEFEAFRQSVYVYVNGTMVGYYEAGVAAVGFDITDYVKAGEENLIAVATDNSASRGNNNDTKETIPGHEPGDASGVSYQWNTKDFNEVQGGLTGNVYLYAKNQIYQTLPLYNNLKTKGNYIYASNFDFRNNSADITVEAEIRNETKNAADITLEVNVVDGDGKLVASFEKAGAVAAAKDTGTKILTTVPETAYDASGAGVETGKADTDTVDVSYITATLNVEGLHFWSDESPYLYKVYTILKQGDQLIDLQETTTGFREVTYDKDKGLLINGVSTYLTGYAQRSTNEWAAIGVANDWLSDIDMQLIKESNANMIRWMHIAPNPVDIRAGDKYGVISICPAGDKEGDQTGRSWDQRLETMRDVIIYYRNSPSILFWEAGNNAITAAHMEQMTNLKKELDPNGGRFMGCRSLQEKNAVLAAEWVGTMIYRYDAAAYSVMKENNYYIPIVETEYHRNESPRRVWDDYTPSNWDNYDYVNKWLGADGSKTDGYDVWDQTQEDFAVTMAQDYAYYYNNRVGGTGNNYYVGAALMVWSDSNMHVRNCGVENCRTSGRVDAIRVKKESFYAIQAIQSKEAAVKILGHWNYPSYIKGDKENGNYWYEDKTFNGTFWEGNGTLLQRDPTKKTVYVIGSPSVTKVELYINDQLAGTSSRPDSNCIYSFSNIDVTQSGKIVAKAYNARDEVVAEDEIKTVGNAATIRLTPVTGPNGLLADGADLMYVDVEVVDESGNVCPIDERKINFTVSDNAKAVFVGGYNSGIGERIVNHKDYVYAECGINRVFLRSTRSAGEFTLTASAEGMQPVTITLSSKDFALTGGLTTEFPQSYAQGEVPELPPVQTAPTLKTLGEPFTADFGNGEESGNVYTASEETRDYYTITVNGNPVTFTDAPYKPDNNTGVVAEVSPILDALKAAGANLNYEFITEGALPDYFRSEGGQLPYLKITAGDTTVELANISTVVFTNGERNLTNFGVAVNSAGNTLIAELSAVLGLPGVTIQSNAEAKVFSVTYGADQPAALEESQVYGDAQPAFDVETSVRAEGAAGYDEVVSNNECNEEINGLTVSSDNGPDGTKYLTNNTGDPIDLPGLDADTKIDLLWEADIRFGDDGKGARPRGNGKEGTCIVRHDKNDKSYFAVQTGSAAFTDYCEIDVTKWYHVELIGRYSASDARIDMTVYEYDGSTMTLIGVYEKVNMRNLYENNNNGAHCWRVDPSVSVDNLRITRLAADTLTVSSQDDVQTVTAGGDLLQFKCDATRQGAYITTPSVTWSLCKEDGTTALDDTAISISSTGLLSVGIDAKDQNICVKATAETGVVGTMLIKINAVDISNVKFDTLTLKTDAFGTDTATVKAGESITIQASATKNGDAVSLSDSDLIWYITDANDMRKVGDSPKWISVKNGVLTVDESAISQDITIRAADPNDIVRGALSVHIKSGKLLEAGEEGQLDILQFSDNCETTRANADFVDSIDGTSAYKAKETYATDTIASSAGFVIEMDIMFAGGEGTGFWARSSGKWNTRVLYHNNQLAVQTGSSSYTSYGEITQTDWYHIALIYKAGAYAHIIFDSYDAEGNIDLSKRKVFKDVNRRNDADSPLVDLQVGTVYDNLCVYTPVPKKIEVSTDVSQVFAGNTVQVTSRLLWNEDLEMLNPDSSTFEYKLYDANNQYPLESDKITINGDGLITVDATADEQEVYVRAISKVSGVYASAKFSVISSDIFAIEGIGITEDRTRIVEIKVNKAFYYTDEVTFITEIFGEDGTVKAVRTRQLYGESLRLGENTVAIGMDIPAGFDAAKDTIRVFAVTKLDADAATTENTAGASVELREGSAYITVPAYDAGTDVLVLLLNRNANEKKVQDSDILYFNQVKAEAVGNAIPAGGVDACIAKTAGKTGGQLAVYAALLGDAEIAPPGTTDPSEKPEQPKKYTIQYVLNGGTQNKKNPASYSSDGNNIKLIDPTKKGYTFVGWYTEKSCKNKITTIKKDAGKDYTLYAKWKKVTVAKAKKPSAKNVKGSKITVSIKAVSGAAGYEISYSTDQKFKKGVVKTTTTKKSYTTKKLKKGKTYYVRVRAYKKDSMKKNVYGDYSAKIKVKITK